MIPDKNVNKPLWYWGEMQDVEELNSAVEEQIGLPTKKGRLFMLLLIPGTVLHEVTHYVMARLLGVEVHAVVLFQFSAYATGMVQHDTDIPEWKFQLIRASPLSILVVGHVWLALKLLPLVEQSSVWLFPYFVLGWYVTYHGLPDQI